MNKNRFYLYISVALIASLLFSLLAVYASSSPRERTGIAVSAKSATLYSPQTNDFLFSKSADMRMPMASTTKIMTALIAQEYSSENDTVRIDQRAVGVEGSSAYLREGEMLTMEELTYALLLQSANDAAAAIAYHISGSIEDFAVLMNQRAQKLGLTNTSFANPHGLDSDEHYTTAHDLAILGAEALKNEKIKEIASTYKKTFISDNRKRTYVNHNKLLLNYNGAIGLKTGFTKKSGRCLVGAAERDGLLLVAVTLDAPNDWNDHEKLLDLGFESLEKLTVAKAHEYQFTIPVVGGIAENVKISNFDDEYIVHNRQDGDIQANVSVDKFAVAPISIGDTLGNVKIISNGNLIKEIELKAEETVKAKRSRNILDRIFGWTP